MDDADLTAEVIPLRGVSASRRRTAPRPYPDGSAAVYPFGGKEPGNEPGNAPGKQPVHPPPQRGEALHWDQRAIRVLDFLRRRVSGAYGVDEYGFDADLAETVLIPAFRPLYDKWFRVEVNGAEHLPETGGALLVSNHGGGLWAADAAMTAIAVHDHTVAADAHSAGPGAPSGRFLRMLAADLVFGTPGLGALARKAGATVACNPDAERLLRAGELVGVWPEGFKGIGKPFRHRYTLQRFGRGGFVHAALRTGAPIIPVSIIGAEEIYPVLGNAKTLARILDLPYFPVTPTFPWLGPLGLVPLPSKWYIEFGEPIETASRGPAAADDAVLLFELADQVRDTIQGTLHRLLLQRRSVWR
ncbi:MAG TPA: lysophospholipid acyltransferase family protein [Jatrophihabitantaceae bacterium]